MMLPPALMGKRSIMAGKGLTVTYSTVSPGVNIKGDFYFIFVNALFSFILSFVALT